MGYRARARSTLDVRQPGESFGAWIDRLHDDPDYLREKAAARGMTPRRRGWLEARASAIEAGGPAPPHKPGDETGIRAI